MKGVCASYKHEPVIMLMTVAMAALREGEVVLSGNDRPRFRVYRMIVLTACIVVTVKRCTVIIDIRITSQDQLPDSIIHLTTLLLTIATSALTLTLLLAQKQPPP